MKRVLALMTLGRDTSSLFPDAIRCMPTDDMELKRLVYLFLIAHAERNPDLAILSINTFLKVQFANNLV